MSQELLFQEPGNNTQARRLSRLRDRGTLRRLAPGIFTSNLRSADDDIVLRNWSRIVSYLAPGSVLSHRSAFDSQPHGAKVYLTRTRGGRHVQLPGLTVSSLLDTGRGPLLDTRDPAARDIPYQRFHVASQPRAFLENLTADRRLAPRQLPRADIEARLERVLILRGERGLNQLRDAAGEVADRLTMPNEYKRLDGLIGALLGTHAASKLTSTQALARARNAPYDGSRLRLFEALAGSLRNEPFADVPEPARTGGARTLFAFAESYFSNYIEGTTFTVEEAEDIVFRGKIILERTKDSHDVKGTFDAALRDPLYSRPPRDAQALLDWLRQANAVVMQGREENRPGEWKQQPNQAGTTLFVSPELVPGTLRAAWSLFATLPHPMQRALFAMFVVAEVHPFADGNGRASRLLMNSFLSDAAHCRIIVPTVFREDYLLALKLLSHQSDASAYMRAMRLCQAWTSLLDYETDVPGLNAQWDRSHAKKEDLSQFRLLSPVTGLPMKADG